MKRLFYVAFVLTVVLIAGCSGNEFFLDFSLPENVSANYNVVYYADSKKGGMTIQTVAPIIEGKCHFRGVTVLPTLLYLTNRNYECPLIIYAGKGDKIKVTGDTANPYTWKVEGGDINKKLSEWRNENASTLLGTDKNSINTAIEKYVRSNPDDPVSTLLLLTCFYRDKNETLYRDLFNLLEGEARSEKWLNLVSRADQLSFAVRPPAKMKSLVMRSYPKGLDTIYTDSVKATLLMFWDMGIDRKKAYFDSIKTISKEFPDSDSRIIADIYLDNDSISWRNQLKRDTLSGTARLWVPEGVASRELIQLGVTHSPYFIVFSSSGEQEYRGDVMDSALNVFRRMVNDTVKRKIDP